MAEKIVKYREEEIWELLSKVMDPEIPVLSITELGIAREVTVKNGHVRIRITPTYSGCPAIQAIEDEIVKRLRINGIQKFEIKKDFSETWTTDWMTEKAKKKLKDYGIAPPVKTNTEADFLDSFKASKPPIPCPYCNTSNTELQSEFGSTACKAQYFCHNCSEPFEHFKCI